MFKGKFEDIVLPQEGFLRGPFGSALKKSLFVPKSEDAYKVYEQSVVLQADKSLGEYYISKEYFEENLSRFEVKSGDFLVSCSGVNYGAIYQLNGKIDKGVINQALLRIRINPQIVDEKYFLYYFRAYIVKKITGGTGDSTIPNFPPMSVVKGIDIQLPDIETQKRIGKILAELDNKIDNNNAINAELESMARTIYDYWFLQFDFPDENGKPYKSSGGKMVWNEEVKREIPEGWEVLKLDKLCDFSNGINYDKNQEGNRNYKIVNVRNITASTLLLDSSDFDDINLLSTQANKYIIEKNDILIARSGTPGAVRLLLSDEEDIIYCGFIIKCSPKNINQRLFLTYALKKLEGSNATTTGGSIMQNVSQETLKQVNICLPSDEIIEKYNKVVTPLLNKMQQIICENQELTSLRNFLLPLLMNGQVGFKN